MKAMDRKHRIIIPINGSLFIYAFIIALPFSWASFVIGSVYRTLTILLFIGFLFVSKFVIYCPLEKRGLFFCWVFYLGYSAASMLWAVNSQAAIINSMSLILMSFIVVVFFSNQLTRKEGDVIDKCWILVGVVCVIFYIFGDKATVGEYGSRTSMIILGTATDPNEFASAFIVPFAIILFDILNGKGKRILQYIMIIVMMYCVLMSGSRGAFFSILVVVLFSLIQSEKINKKSILFFFIAGVLMTAIIIQFIIPMIPDDVLVRMSLKSLLEDGGSGRTDLWSDGIKKIWSGSVFRMIFGYGQYGLTVGTSGTSQTMHNQFIQQLSNYGIVGLFLYIILIFRSYKTIKINCPRYIGAFWGMMFMSLTITMSIAYKLLWILLLVPAAMKEDTRDKIYDE